MIGNDRGRGDRGVALLIALVVTALLIALVFEFAYGTRVSLRGAVNFRDSQRAYYLARSGVSFVGKLLADNLKKGKLQDNLEQREWQAVPIISTGDSELLVRWDDEAGKINISNVRDGQDSLKRLERLFGLPGMRIDLEALDRIRELQSINLVGDLHKVLSDEEYRKIQSCNNDQGCVTVYGLGTIDINTASSEVLQSLGISEPAAATIIEARKQDPFSDKSKLASSYGLDSVTLGMLDVKSNVFLVRSYATVGGYTKQAEAVITRDLSFKEGYTVQYRKIL